MSLPSESTLSTLAPPAGRARPVLLVVVALLVTLSLVHPMVPRIILGLRDALHGADARNIGYMAHAMAYFTLTCVVLSCVDCRSRSRRRLWMLLIVAHAMLSELGQLLIPARDFDPLDMACNLLAAATACMLWWAVAWRRSPLARG